MKMTFIFPLKSQSDTSIWNKFPLIVNIFFITLRIIETCLIYFHWISTSGGLKYAVRSLFSILALTNGITLLILAMRWPKISLRWSKQESVFRKFPYQMPDKNITALLTSLTVLTILFTFCINTTWVTMKVVHTLESRNNCKLPVDYNFFAHYYRKERPHVFRFINFRLWMSPIMYLQHLFTDFCWMLSHNLNILLSIWVSARLKQLLQRIKQNQRLERCMDRWMTVYEDFKVLVELIEDVDQEIGIFVIITCLIRLHFLVSFISKLLW